MLVHHQYPMNIPWTAEIGLPWESWRRLQRSSASKAPFAGQRCHEPPLGSIHWEVWCGCYEHGHFLELASKPWLSHLYLLYISIYMVLKLWTWEVRNIWNFESFFSTWESANHASEWFWSWQGISSFRFPVPCTKDAIGTSSRTAVRCLATKARPNPPIVGITRGPWSQNHQSNRLLGILKTHLKTYERLITYKIYKISPVPCLVYITYPRVNSETAQHGKAMSQGPGGPLMMICRANPEPVLPEILGAREWLK